MSRHHPPPHTYFSVKIAGSCATTTSKRKKAKARRLTLTRINQYCRVGLVNGHLCPCTRVPVSLHILQLFCCCYIAPPLASCYYLGQGAGIIQQTQKIGSRLSNKHLVLGGLNLVHILCYKKFPTIMNTYLPYCTGRQVLSYSKSFVPKHKNKQLLHLRTTYKSFFV